MATKEEIKRALKAFKKRLKLTRRDDESSLGGGKLTKGEASAIIGIRLPDGHSEEAWRELETKNRIKRIPGTQTYELIRPPQQ